MKRIGLLGGMSWESTDTYYQLLNEAVRDRFGGLSSAPILLDSVNFADIEKMQRDDDWAGAGQLLATRARALEAGGADMVAICTNTMHLVAADVASAISIPLVDILDVTAKECLRRGYTTVGLLGTAYTMSSPFFRQRYATFGVRALVPSPEAQASIHRVIFGELCVGRNNPASKDLYLSIVDELVAAGAQAVVLGCTEIGLLLADGDAQVPLLDTTRIHCDALLAAALDGE